MTVGWAYLILMGVALVPWAIGIGYARLTHARVAAALDDLEQRVAALKAMPNYSAVQSAQDQAESTTAYIADARKRWKI